MKHRLFPLTAEMWAGIALFVLGVVYWLGADALPRSSLGGSVGAAGMPKVLAVALCIMSALLILQSMIASPGKRKADAAQLPSRYQALRAGGFWLIAVAFVVVLPWVGYPVAVMAALLAIGFYYGRRPSPALFAFAIGAAAIVSLLFMKVLGVPMPTGIWPDLLG